MAEGLDAGKTHNNKRGLRALRQPLEFDLDVLGIIAGVVQTNL